MCYFSGACHPFIFLPVFIKFDWKWFYLSTAYFGYKHNLLKWYFLFLIYVFFCILSLTFVASWTPSLIYCADTVFRHFALRVFILVIKLQNLENVFKLHSSIFLTYVYLWKVMVYCIVISEQQLNTGVKFWNFDCLNVLAMLWRSYQKIKY